MDKDNFPENSIMYINQGYLTVKDNKKMFIRASYRGHKSSGEVKFYRPRFDSQTGQFLSLYEL